MYTRAKTKFPKKETRVYIPPNSNRGMAIAEMNRLKQNSRKIKGGRRP